MGQARYGGVAQGFTRQFFCPFFLDNNRNLQYYDCILQ